MSFSALGLGPTLCHAANQLGFFTPTPVQTEAIPAILRGLDVQAQAQTGSGKTAAYALPLLEHGARHRRGGYRRVVQALVLVPTRELALQVGELLATLSEHQTENTRSVPLRIVTLFGGVSINPQLMALRAGADIVVATPGRLLDIVAHNGVALDQVQQCVLDEADRLLDLGFSQELQQIQALLPTKRQNLLFSATFPPDVQQLTHALLQQPVCIHIEQIASVPADIQQRALAVETPRRTALLRHLVQNSGLKPVLVFVASQYSAEHVAHKLGQQGLYATAFHGGLSQGARRDVLEAFKAGRWDVLVTTDLAARGIDIDNLPAVINYDLPRSAVDYVHRIGRTGRAGSSGQAISFVTPEQLPHWHLIQKRQQLTLTLETISGFEPTAGTPESTLAQRPGKLPPGTGGVKGKRPSKKDKLRAAAAHQKSTPDA